MPDGQRPASADRRQFEAESLEHRGIVGSLRSIEDFNADDAAFGIVVDDDVVSDFLAVLDRAIGQVELDRVRSMVRSHAHGFVLSKYAVMTYSGSRAGVTTRNITCRPGKHFKKDRPLPRHAAGFQSRRIIITSL